MLMIPYGKSSRSIQLYNAKKIILVSVSIVFHFLTEQKTPQKKATFFCSVCGAQFAVNSRDSFFLFEKRGSIRPQLATIFRVCGFRNFLRYLTYSVKNLYLHLKMDLRVGFPQKTKTLLNNGTPGNFNIYHLIF